MINCQQAREYMSLQLDEMLDDSLKDQYDEHLHQCNSCREYKNSFDMLHFQLISIPDIKLEESVVDRLITSDLLSKEKTMVKPSNSFFKRKLLPWYGVAAAILLGILFIPSILLPSNSQNDLVQHDVLVQQENREYEMAKAPQMSIMDNEAAISPPIQVELIENQLIISKDQNEIYRTKKWADDYVVQWQIVNENQVKYFIYDHTGKQVDAYNIDLLKKQEEKLIN